MINLLEPNELSVTSDGNVLDEHCSITSNTISLFEKRTTICSSRLYNVNESVENQNETVEERVFHVFVVILIESFELIVMYYSKSKKEQCPRQKRENHSIICRKRKRTEGNLKAINVKPIRIVRITPR